MNRLPLQKAPAVAETDWMPFPGGELEGKRPRALCPDCRARARHEPRAGAVPPRPALCFQCYRVELERTRSIQAAAALDTASDARFQALLPLEPVDRHRLARLKAERQSARAEGRAGAGLYIEKRRRAQIEARHALALIMRGLRERRVAHLSVSSMPQARAAAAAIGHAPARQYPASWLPFVAAQ